MQTIDAHEVSRRLSSLGSVYQTTDSILAGENIRVAITQQGPAPAWTDGATITLNAAQVEAPDFDDVVRLHGLNFHELAHVRYTPRKGTSLVSWVIENHLMQSFNALEDQRIESLMTLRYPSTVPWLTAAILRWVVDSPQSLPGAYALLRGRRYLPGELRGALRQMFVAPDLLPEIDAVVDAYRRLVFPQDYEVAKDLIARFNEVMRQLAQQMGPNGIPDPHGHDCKGGEVLDKGRPASVSEQRSIRDSMSAPAAHKDDTDEEESDEEGDTASAAQAGDDTDEVSDEQQDGSTELPTQDDTDERYSAPQTSSPWGMGEEIEAAPEEVEDTFDIADMAQDLLDDLLDTDEVYNEVRRTQREMTKQGDEMTLPRPSWGYSNVDPDQAYSTLLQRLKSTLQRLQSQADPGWNREQPTGRINPARWAVTQDVERAFDRWNEGVHDALDIEVALLMDYSGSMDGIQDHVTNAMWVLKRAFDSVNISTTVIGYSTQSVLIYDKNERASHVARQPQDRHLMGQTIPLAALEQTTRIMAASRCRHKVVIIITDGEWHWAVDEYDNNSEDYIQKMNSAGVLTALGFIVDPRLWHYLSAEEMTAETRQKVAQKNSHGVRIAAPADAQSMVPFVSSIVTNLIRSQLRGAA